jgi:hypothetical protein
MRLLHRHVRKVPTSRLMRRSKQHHQLTNVREQFLGEFYR